MKRMKNKCLIAFAVLLLLTCTLPLPAKAAPEEEKGWIDLEADVPRDFNGSVTILLLRAEDEEHYSISAYFLNDYKNSIQLPVGTYTVEHAYTSEDPLAYEAFIETDSFRLDTVQKLTVQVKHNAAGESFVATDPDADTGDNTPETNTPEQEIPSASDSSNTNDKHEGLENSSDSLSEEKPEASEDSSVPEAKTSPWMTLLKQLVVILLGSGVFALLLFGSVYLIRRFTKND